jgi:hypothetical protein
MSCCGNKRAALISNSTYSPYQKSLYLHARPAPQIKASQETKNILFKYLGHGSISMQGPSTGQVYIFSEGDHITAVHAEDSQVLLRTGLFSLMEEKEYHQPEVVTKTKNNQ